MRIHINSFFKILKVSISNKFSLFIFYKNILTKSDHCLLLAFGFYGHIENVEVA